MRLPCSVVVALSAFLQKLLCMLALFALPSSAQWPVPKPLTPFDKKRIELELEQSQRHLEYGLELRKQGMPTQAAAEIIHAAELGNGRNSGATQVMYIMRQYDAAFWKKYGSKASKGKVDAYAKKSGALLLTEQKESLDLANWASTHDFDKESQELYVDILLARDEPLSFDAKGQIVLPAGTISAKAAAKLREGAITINAKLYVRDELLTKLPELKEIFEVTSDELRVRTTTTLEDAREIHAMCSQLLPALVEDMGAKAERRLPLFVFAKRTDFEKTLDALDLSDHKIVSGVATPWPFVAIVCAEDLAPEIAHGVCLHEATHLFTFAVTHTVFPAWYKEGYADTFGGTSTFTWDGTKLTLQGLLDRWRLDALKADGGLLPLSELLVADQLVYWKRSKDAGLAFSAEAWAFVRYLRSGAGAEIAAKFEQWETRCMGQALGYELGAKRPSARGPASDLFIEQFGKDLPKLEIGFKLWLSAL